MCSSVGNTMLKLMNKGKIFLLGIVCLCGFGALTTTSGQTSIYPLPTGKDSTVIFAEVSTLASSSERTPFWLHANQFGIIATKAPATNIHGVFEHFVPIGYSKKTRRWRIGGAIEVAANISAKTEILVPQLNGSIRYKNFELFVGRKKQWIGLADSTLGSGSYIWSTNAMPIPKIQIGTIGFVSVPMTNGWLSVNGFYSEGFFESKRQTTSELKLHQKMLYVRIGQNDSRVKLYGGFNHQVQWGGKSSYLTIDGKMPTGWGNYYRIITGKPGDANQIVNSFDDGNRVGNHLGTIDLGVEVETFSTSFFVYRQNIYEDGTLYALTNIKDGLNGIRFRRKNSYGAAFEVTEGVFEFLFTKSQGGPEFNVENYVIKRGDFGRDNYFNNSQIRDGWSYYNRTIGTPFIPPTSDTDFRWPKYADFFTSNNRVSAFHAGLRGRLLNHIFWVTKLSYSTNIGTYDGPFSQTARQFSGLISMQRKINILDGMTIRASFAADIGQLYRPSFGGMIGIRKDFTLNPARSFSARK
jgi:hypothetical protein